MLDVREEDIERQNKRFCIIFIGYYMVLTRSIVSGEKNSVVGGLLVLNGADE